MDLFTFTKVIFKGKGLLISAFAFRVAISNPVDQRIKQNGCRRLEK